MRIHTIDLNFQGFPNTIASYLVEGESGLALIESGPQSTVENCVSGLQSLGFAASDVKHVFVTHIPLDHAGGAGWWAGQGAQVYVHGRGARHLIDPSRLMASAAMVYGDALESLFGLMIPIPEAQVTILEDGDVVSIGDIKVEALEASGHAKHQHAYLVEGNAFTGDAAGSRIGDARFINLTSAPPQFDPHTFDQTITRLAERKLGALYLGHFGAVTDVEAHLERLREVMWSSAEFIHAQIRNGQSRDTVIEKYIEFCKERARLEGVSESEIDIYDVANGFEMSGSGVHLYWEKLRQRGQ